MSRPRNAESPAAEDRQRQTGDDLVGAETDAQQRVDGRHRRAGGKGHRGADPGAARPDAGAGAGEGAHEHDPLDAEVEDPGALGDQLAETGEEDRGPGGDGRRQHGDDECRGEDVGHGEGDRAIGRGGDRRSREVASPRLVGAVEWQRRRPEHAESAIGNSTCTLITLSPRHPRYPVTGEDVAAEEEEEDRALEHGGDGRRQARATSGSGLRRR